MYVYTQKQEVPHSLTALEAARTKLLQQFLTLGDFRPGTVPAASRRCGKPTCHCAKPGSAGHPQFRLLRKVHGKSVAESFSKPAAFRQAVEQVDEFHRFQQLSAELTALHEQICRLRAVESTPGGRSQEKKKTVAIHQEIAQEVQTRLQVIFGALGERTLRWTWKPSRWPCAVHYRHCRGIDFDIGEGWTGPSTPQANTSNATMKPTDAGRFL